MSGRFIALMLAVCLSWPGSPALAGVLVDYAALGSFTDASDYYANCGVIARSSADLLVNAPGAGLAVAGGSDTAIDGEEWVSFEINQSGEKRAARALAIEVAAEPGGDGDATPGEIVIDAWGPGAVLLGVQAFSGGGVYDVSAAFPGEPIALIGVTPNPDPVRVLAVEYELTAAAEISANFWDIGTFQAPSVSLCGVTLSGSSTLDVSAGGGVGVVGTGELQLNDFVDVGEVLTVALDAPSATLRYRPWAGIGSVRFSLQGHDADGQPLAALPVEDPTIEEIDVTALYAGAVLSGFSVTAGTYFDGGHSLGRVVRTVPEPRAPAGAAAALALAVSAALRPRSA